MVRNFHICVSGAAVSQQVKLRESVCTSECVAQRSTFTATFQLNCSYDRLGPKPQKHLQLSSDPLSLHSSHDSSQPSQANTRFAATPTDDSRHLVFKSLFSSVKARSSQSPEGCYFVDTISVCSLKNRINNQVEVGKSEPKMCSTFSSAFCASAKQFISAWVENVQL